MHTENENMYQKLLHSTQKYILKIVTWLEVFVDIDEKV